MNEKINNVTNSRKDKVSRTFKKKIQELERQQSLIEEKKKILSQN